MLARYSFVRGDPRFRGGAVKLVRRALALCLSVALLALSLMGCEEKPQLREDPLAVASREHPEGEKIYTQYCISCHQAGISGAYRLGDTQAWQKELQEHTLDELVALAIAGEGAMPARGLCSQCTDEQIRETTLYMIKGSGVTP